MAAWEMLSKLIGFLRAGYPDVAPASGHAAALALLRRRLTDEEVAAVARSLFRAALVRGHLAIDATDIRVAITKITQELPTLEDTERVAWRLRCAGVIIVDEFDTRAG